ncbi:carboxymuconolactone decarboxylase family protein [Qipengyuania spongiae]|uniref:Carboxymuconolactone decarboxylase family protein n=1 Tax=Qipengyuania spongiae TaxID=2909673 RepID=A0ABY5T3B7_9SPHN|nr:carboxymuconolactone decarboxylase family protein [Qipengyuania spongiae]UVI39484.1 carboxymuconolactone decarboxylase family protein [Qipengyuania spongiae]
MTIIRTLAAAGVAAAAMPAGAQEARTSMEPPMTVSPALDRATRDTLLGEVWQDEQLSQRDRGLVTIAALVARNQTAGLDEYVGRALDAGVEPSEISETLYHLAYYAGWQNAMAAEPVVAEVFASRDIGADAMPAVDPSDMLPLDDEAEAQRQSNVQSQYGDVSQGVVNATEQLLFRDLWLRPALAARDRSMVTVAALIAGGHTEQITFHLGRAMDNGLTKPEASAMLHHLAFYAGWPNIFSAMPVAKDVFESRAN